MKKCFYALAALFCLASMSVQAAPGDTTWVQANNRRLDNGSGYGNYDTSVAFPSGSTTYRKILMIFNLGEYPCPPGTQYCHQWDYTVTNFLMNAAGDTIELSRLITPYANTGVPRFPSTWNKDYVFDVSDYAPLLKGNAAIRIFYSGYSAGFTANIRFAFIEGTPERTVTGFSNLWSGSWLFGKAIDPIDNHVVPRTRTAPAGTQSAALKVTITGHGSDNNDCCEFDDHEYKVKLNGNEIDSFTIWKDDCGRNQLYPQGGTWIFDRANWCPGELIRVNTHLLPGVTAATSYNLDLDFDAYTAGNTSYGSYSLNGTVIYYGGINKTVDASVEDIITPTIADEHFRENPGGSSPIFRLRNTGSTTITSAVIRYGVKDSASAQYTWSGSLVPLRETTIVLPALNTLTNMSMGAASGSYQFAVEVISVNGQADNDATNNKMTSTFVVAPVWASDLVVTLRTNSQGRDSVTKNPSQTSWKIVDMNNNVVAERVNANVSTIYTDTVHLRDGGFYKLQIDDGGCDGLQWWLWAQNPSEGITAGSIGIKRLGTLANLPMKGYSFSGTFNNDFGCIYTQYFTTKGWSVGIGNVNAQRAHMEAYPNPATNEVTVQVAGVNKLNGQIALLDMSGREMMVKPYTGGKLKLDATSIAGGVYQLVYTNNADKGLRITQKIVIAK